MASKSLRDQLNHLHALIMEERECAKKLAIDDLMAVSQKKAELLASLESAESLDSQDRELAETIRYENKRNAYLFWASLGFIRESMSFFQQQLPAVSYGAHGDTVRGNSEGMLLRGRI